MIPTATVAAASARASIHLYIYDQLSIYLSMHLYVYLRLAVRGVPKGTLRTHSA